MTNSPALEMKNIKKTFGTVKANDDISFSVEKGSLHALAGENGAGKSTLMKILFGIEHADGGEVFVNGRQVRYKSPLEAIADGIGMVQQHFALADSLTALDNIILGCEPHQRMSGKVNRGKALENLQALAGEHLKVNWALPVENLSLGEKQRVEILKLLYRQAKVLILDEPTAVLTPQEVERFFGLLKILKNQGATIVLITHKLPEIFSFCDRVTVLRGGRGVATREVEGLTEDELIRLMVGHSVSKPTIPRKLLEKPLLELDSVVTTHVTGALKGVSLKICPGEIVGIAGVEGNGQAALVEAMLRLCLFKGEINIHGAALKKGTLAIRESGMALIPEDRHHQGLWLEESVFSNGLIGLEKKKEFSKNGLIRWSAVKDWVRGCIAQYGIKAEDPNAAVKNLSGGNQQKLIVARELEGRNPTVLIASQPTRGVDIGAIEFIHGRFSEVAQKGAGILLISSELDELFAMSTRILVLYQGRIVGEFAAAQGYSKDLIGRLMTGGRVA